MPELVVDDVERYTKSRLAKSDAETVRLLATGLAAARRYCGWHVTPTRTETVTLDGSGAELLLLPTLRLATLHAVTEDGVELGLNAIEVSPRGLLRKKSGARWTTAMGGIAVSITHGFADAPEWQSAVLSFIDRTSLAVGGGQRETVGPFSFTETPVVAGSAFTDVEKLLLDLYRLEPRA